MGPFIKNTLKFALAFSSFACGQNEAAKTIDLGPKGYNPSQMALNMDKTHVAIVAERGSRMAVYVDGHPQADYDKIDTDPPVVSADGMHWAVAAHRNNELYMVVDGKEYGPYRQVPTYYSRLLAIGPLPAPFQLTPRQPLVFSPDGKHWAFYAQKKERQDVVVEDGKEIATGKFDQTASLLFSSHGDHLVFVMGSVDRDGVRRVYLDGVPGPIFMSIKAPQFTHDGRHLIYLGEEGLKASVIEDGRPGPLSGTISSLSISDDGSHIAYVVHLPGQVGHPLGHLVIDGKVADSAEQVWMTPDGRSIAYSQRGMAGMAETSTDFVNGKPGLPYRSINNLRFAPDGHVIYEAEAFTGKHFLVDGDKESEPYDSVKFDSILFSCDGRHMAYAAMADRKSFVVLDGKKLQDFRAILQPPDYNGAEAIPATLRFLPGGHIMYYGQAAAYNEPRGACA